MKLKQSLSVLLLLLLLLASFASCNTGKPQETTPESPEESTTAAETDDPAVLKTNWHFGYVGSDTNADAYTYMLNNEGVGYSYTDVITLEKAGTKITFTDPNSGETDSGVFVISTWVSIQSKWMINSKGTNIAGESELVMTATDAGTVYSYVTSEDNESIRLCYRSGQESASDTVEHPAIRTELTDEPGTATLILTEDDLLMQWIEADKSRAYYELLEGKTFTVIGDSYLAGSSLGKEGAWPTLLAKKYNMEYKNYAIGGSTISNYVTTNHPMVDRYGEMIGNNPDIVIVEGGRNDYNHAVPMGTLEDTSTTTMMGATRYLLTKIREKYPNAVIIGLTCWETGGNKNAAGHYCREYGEAMLAVCADMGIPCINALDQDAMGVYMTDEIFRMEYCLTPTDISHLNLDGMKKVLPVFEKYIKDIYEEHRTD